MPWTRDFRLKIIALSFEHNWWVAHGDVIKPDYMETTAEVIIVKSLSTFMDRYNRLPTLDEMTVYISMLPQVKEPDRVEALELAQYLYANKDFWDLEFARDEFLEFARIQALKLAMAQAIDDIEEGKLDDIDRNISQALRVGVTANTTIRLVRDVDLWMDAAAQAEKISTGFYHVDQMLEGGLNRGEVGVIIAPPNYGKTMSLVNIGEGAAASNNHHKVNHWTLEVSKEITSKRYAARMTFEWLNKNRLDAYRARFLSQADRLLHGSDIDIYGAAPGTVSITDIRRYLDLLQRTDFPVDVLIIDYADEMKMPRGENSFERHGENYRQLKQLAIDYNIALWTASQSTRGSLRKLTIDLDDIAESFQKAARADVVLAWCQTPEEEEEHEMRFFCAKNRDGQKHWYVRCKIIDQAHAIVTEDVIWGNELLDEQKDKRKMRRE